MATGSETSSAGALRSQRFRAEREEQWRDLEALLDRAEKRGVRALSDAELLRIPGLYQATLSALSVARATSLDRVMTEYLESLSARAYYFVYGARTPLMTRIGRFFSHDWPASVRDQFGQTLLCAAVLLVSAILAYVMVMADSEWYYAFVNGGLAQGRDPTADPALLRETLYGGTSDDQLDELSVFSTFLFTHNTRVAILAFALGFAFAAPSIMLMSATGLMMGAMIAVFANAGLGFEMGGWLSIHGVTEILAVVLAGAAGLRIGWAVAFPGNRTRLDAAAAEGRRGGVVMIGCVIMLAIAGLLEGFGRQLVEDDITRYAFGAVTGLIWAAYFGLAGRFEETRHG
jgi:uncharacterized membrane protein SpoIIM required for sporulation